MRTTFILFVIAFLATFSCKNRPANQADIPAQAEQTSSTAANLPEAFNTFYEKFHQDSLFQINHVIWPLKGEKGVQTDTSTTEIQAYSWTPETWIMHHPIDYSNNDYVREVSMMGDFMVIEIVKTKLYGYGIERRFAKQADGDWALIYYSDMKQR
jgi:hypothetical protein